MRASQPSIVRVTGEGEGRLSEAMGECWLIYRLGGLTQPEVRTVAHSHGVDTDTLLEAINKEEGIEYVL